MPRRPLVALVLLVGASAAAQTAYDRTPGDTLRYREVTTARTETASERGAGWFESEHDATIALAFGADGEARAAYEALDLALVSPRIELVPETDPVLGRPFALAFPASGRVRTEAAPPFPEDVTAMTDLTRQFDDFFLVLPDTPLALGLVWADSTREAGTGPDGEAEEDWSRGRYRVVADTVLDGRRAFLVKAEIERGARSSETDAELGFTSTFEMRGVEESVFAFAPDPGVLLWRDRTGRMKGRQTVKVEEASDVTTLVYAYESTIDFVDEGP